MQEAPVFMCLSAAAGQPGSRKPGEAAPAGIRNAGTFLSPPGRILAGSGRVRVFVCGGAMAKSSEKSPGPGMRGWPGTRAAREPATAL